MCDHGPVFQVRNSKLVLGLVDDADRLQGNWVVIHHWPQLWHPDGFVRPNVDCHDAHREVLSTWTSFWTCFLLGDQEGEGRSPLVIVNLEVDDGCEMVDPCDRS